MQYIKAETEFSEEIFRLVQDTITTIYPEYYLKEVVNFFCELHSRENIRLDIEKGNVAVLISDNNIVGTGSYQGNHITRVYVDPKCQRNGYGSFIMEKLENEISQNFDEVYLDASFPALGFYRNRGYKTLRYEKYPVKNDVVLVYQIMVKKV